MGVGAASAVSGQMSLQEATRSTIHRMAQKGIPAFVDKRGREWSPEAYVMMDMRSTLANTARAAQNKRCDEYGIQLIEVSSHMGARPKCAPYQGRIFSRDGSSGSAVDGIGNRVTYTPLSSTSFGEPDGLFGINCGHVQYPFIPGITSQTYYPYNREANAERYKEFQRQRAMERDIRATKRECMMLQAAGDQEGLQAASQRLRKQKEKYGQFCTDTGLGSHLDRTQVYGYDRSKSAKTVWAERKAAAKVNAFESIAIEPDELEKTQKANFMKNFSDGFTKLPKKHQDIVRSTVKKLRITNDGSNSSFEFVEKLLTFNHDATASEVIHECAHVIYDSLRLYENAEFIEILKSGLNLDNGFDIDYTDIIDNKGNTRTIYFLKSSKFVHNYQGRLYFDMELYNNVFVDSKAYFFTDPINPMLLQEYFSVGYETYFEDPNLLKAKDVKLFNYIEKMVKSNA